jgi:hypothetical protein
MIAWWELHAIAVPAGAAEGLNDGGRVQRRGIALGLCFVLSIDTQELILVYR